MPGRPIRTDERPPREGHPLPATAMRRAVLRQTIEAFASADPPDRFHRLAADNLARWHAAAGREPEPDSLALHVLPGDWGVVTLDLTRRHGTPFAVLNMANADVPGGGYVEGLAAQEENMFRRTDCHFSLTDDVYDTARDRYRPEMTRLLRAADGRVYLDTGRPRVCLRGPEDRGRPDLGYAWLPEDEVFPFLELRASAQDLRGGARFDPGEARRRIAAQLDTLRRAGLRHAVLGAFGCGAFGNPAAEVARLYGEEIEARRGDFSVLAFAVFHAGYGPDNHRVFSQVLG